MNSDKRKKISGWGRYPRIDADVLSLDSAAPDHAAQLQFKQGIARGMGRSYGDSSLSSTVIDTTKMNRILSFDENTGILRCESGVTLNEILDIFVNRGWFLPVTPGTKHITVGGAVASDIHGKNHHTSGCFSEYVVDITLMGADGRIHHCSSQRNTELFRATCGGMGLTGIILEVSFRLIRVESAYFDVHIHKSKDLEETFNLFEKYQHWPYSVAWIDSMATGPNLGRSLLMLGKNRSDGQFDYSPDSSFTIPFQMPSLLLNHYTISAFNTLYYHRITGDKYETVEDIDAFFYPLDFLANWNLMYGARGFVQYQCVLPRRKSFDGLKNMLRKIAEHGKGSFLSVLKLMGPENDNYLSFPLEGYTLALDFKVESGLFELLDELDRIVMNFDGRIYLTKDARMSKEIFEKGYPDLALFRQVRNKWGASGIFESTQSKRLEI